MKRAKLGITAIFLAAFVVGGLQPAQAFSQECGEDEEECDYGKITREKRKDGSVWICFEWIDCGTITGEELCLKME